MGGRGRRIARNGAERCAEGAAQHRQRVGPGLLGFGKGEVETQREVAALGQLALEVFDEGIGIVAIRPVGEHDAHPRPGWPPARDPEHPRDRDEPVDRLGERDLELFDARGRLDHTCPLGPRSYHGQQPNGVERTRR